MCTVTFFPIDEHSYILSTNRDELKTRKKALSPKLAIKNHTTFLRPVDGDKGGTWIAVNDNHLSLCIMNWYQAYQNITGKSDFTTRGNIIHELIDSINLETCTQKLSKIDLTMYQPFRLIGVQVTPMHLTQWQWNGQKLETINKPIDKQIWVSAGLEYDKVYENRKNVFKSYTQKNGSLTMKDIMQLHASEIPQPGKYAICMSGEKASTVSNTIILSRPNLIEMHYLNGFPATSSHWVIKELLTSNKSNEMVTSR